MTQLRDETCACEDSPCVRRAIETSESGDMPLDEDVTPRMQVVAEDMKKCSAL